MSIAVLFLVSFRIPRNLMETPAGGPYDNDTAYKEKAADITLGKQSAVNSSAKTDGFNEIFDLARYPSPRSVLSLPISSKQFCIYGPHHRS